MKKSSRIAVLLSLLVAAYGVSMTLGARPAALASPSQQPNGGQTEKNQRLRVRNLLGDDASAHVKQLRKLHKGIERAMKDAEKRGLREAFGLSAVTLANDPDQPASFTGLVPINKPSAGFFIQPALFSPLSAQDFTQDGYEVAFIPYDDGDPNTWEGIIYRNGPDIDEDTRYAVINIETDEPAVVADTYYPPDGGDPLPGHEMLMTKLNPRGRHNKGTFAAMNHASASRLTCSTGAIGMKVTASGTTGFQCPAGQHRCIGHEAVGCCGPIPPLDNWMKCSLWGSGGSAITCVRTGPAFGECWAIRTAASMFVCLGR